MGIITTKTLRRVHPNGLLQLSRHLLLLPCPLSARRRSLLRNTQTRLRSRPRRRVRGSALLVLDPYPDPSFLTCIALFLLLKTWVVRLDGLTSRGIILILAALMQLRVLPAGAKGCQVPLQRLNICLCPPLFRVHGPH